MSSSSLAEGASAVFEGVSIARACRSSEAWEAFERTQHRHFEIQVGAVANLNP